MKIILKLFAAAAIALAAFGCKEPEAPIEKPTIEISGFTFDEESMKLSATITPSQNSESWAWKYEATEDSGKDYTKVDGAEATAVEFEVEYGVSYKVYAYAVNQGVQSDTVQRSYAVPQKDEPVVELPEIAFGEMSFNAASMEVAIAVVPSENAEKWCWKYEVEGAAVEEYTSVEGNKADSVRFTIEYDKNYKVYAHAENKAGKTEDVVKEFKYDAPEAGEEANTLVSMEIKNLSSYSMDVEVKVNQDSVRYAIGGMLKSAYKRKSFLESAKSSLNPSESYPYVSFNSDSQDRVFSEQDLRKDALITKEENAGLIIMPFDEDGNANVYTIAVYAVSDKKHPEIEQAVYTVDVTIPAPEITGNIDVTIDIPEDKIGITEADVTFSASEECKLVIGHADAVSNAINFATDSREDCIAEILTYYNTLPMICNEPTNVLVYQNILMDTEYVVYAIAIDKEGKLGEVEYKVFKTKKPVFTGEGTVTSAEIPAQTSADKLNVNMSTSSDVKKVRLYCSTANDFCGDANVSFIMTDEDSDHLVADYDVIDGELSVALDIYHPGDKYYVYACAIDADGNLSAPQNIVELATGSESYKTIDESEIYTGVEFGGSGNASMTVAQTAKEDAEGYEYYAADVTISFDSETVKNAWLIRYNDDEPANIETLVKATCAEYPESQELIGSYKAVESGETYSYDDPMFLAPTPQYRWGTMLVLITEDTDGKFKICQYYVAGSNVVKNF